MKLFNIIFCFLIFLNIVSAQEKKASIGFCLKPGINYLSKNSFTQNTNETSVFEWGIGTYFITNKKTLLPLILNILILKVRA